MNISTIKRSDIPIPIVQDKAIEQFEDIKKYLVYLNNGVLILPPNVDTIELNEFTSEVDNWNDKGKFHRAMDFVMTTIRECKLTKLTYTIIEHRRKIWITKQV